MKQFSTYQNMKNAIVSPRVFLAQTGTQSMGMFQVRCVKAGMIPIPDARVRIYNAGQRENSIEELITNEIGLTDIISLMAPPLDLSLEPQAERPFAIYDVIVDARGYDTAIFLNVEIFANVLAIQEVILRELPKDEELEEVFDIAPNTLYGDFPPKIPEDEIKPIKERFEITLDQVVIPEYIIVHDGLPTSNAPNYWIRFRDYIKNVACSEIYATWPEATIYANVLAILSFTLNRVYTEWYRNQGYYFTITSSTAFDHKWSRGRNIFQNISIIVDSVFVNYLSRPNVKQPILTQYCDGYRVKCPNWMTQWGSKTLGDEGYSAIEILRNFYGSNMFINTATEVSGVPLSWPGSSLTVGSRDNNVRKIQEQLNEVASVYSAIPKLVADGIFGAKTAESIKAFQRIFNLPVTGVVDRATWYKISHIYVAVTRMAE